MLKALDPFYPCLLVLRAIGFFCLLFLFLSIFSPFFFCKLSFSLLFLASRINFMIFQIINNISLCSSFFQEPTILTFINNKFKRHMHCSSIHSENKKYCHHINIIKLNSRINSKLMYFLFFCIKNIFHLREVKDLWNYS